MNQEADDPYHWAEHLHWMEGGFDILETNATTGGPEKPRLLPGLALVTCLGLASVVLVQSPLLGFLSVGGRQLLDPIMLSILLGLLLGNLIPLPGVCVTGIKYSVKKVLPFGVVLLGARLDFHDVVLIGTSGLALSALIVVTSVGMIWALGALLGVSCEERLLLGVGTGICGGTAIVAVAPLMQARDENVVISISIVTLLGLGAMLILPVLGGLLAMAPLPYGAWVGLTVHQTPQVIAAGFALGPIAGQTATIIKMARVCMLAPVALAIGIGAARQRREPLSGKLSFLRLIPLFIVGFLAMALARTLGLLPDLQITWPEVAGFDATAWTGASSDLLVMLSGFLLAVSMAGVGLETRIKSLRRVSGRSLLLATLGAIGLSAICLVAVLIVYPHQS